MCIKSEASRTQKCALCRADIDVDLDFGHLDVVGNIQLPCCSEDGYFWFYEGKTGWWMYDADTNSELEKAFRNGIKRIEKLIAGEVYVLSLRRLTQYRKDDRSRARKICRETLKLRSILGLAGLRDMKLLERLSCTKNSEDLRF